ncbi:MAG: bacteriocin/lantibiotic ABC transporter, partial [Gammaproteobacteria bacterium]|nr:bacteriocin/lantibiotic ABC transporter [Gammaproteobacteria bacterium]
ETRRWVTPFEVFERTWQRADFWALVILPAGEIPETATSLRYLKTAYAFEETGHTNLALDAYRSASQRWPEVADTWMTLGNVVFHNKDWPNAITAFSTACRVQPKSIANWNNLAYALHAYGCDIQARTALQCGLNISPTDKNLLDSWQEITVNPEKTEPLKCPVVQCGSTAEPL